MSPRPVPAMQTESYLPLQRVRAGEGFAEYDAIHYTTAKIRLCFKAKKGTKVRLIWSECYSVADAQGNRYKAKRDAYDHPAAQLQGAYDTLVATGEEQTFALLMERFEEYQIKTSITPAYTLLSHGVGDSNAVAVVYAAMCQRVGVECQVVVGTRSGEPWSWNIVRVDDDYYHVDLYDCQQRGSFRMLTDAQMQDYVWDGIKRDRLVWMGDLYPEVITAAAVLDAADPAAALTDLVTKGQITKEAAEMLAAWGTKNKIR